MPQPTITSALKRGLGQARRSWRLLLLLWLVNVAVALPFALLLGQALAGSFGGGLVEETMREGFDTAWYGEYLADARGLEKTFTPALLGVGAPLLNLDAWWSGQLFSQHPGLVGIGVGYALLWAFLLGGIIDFLAGNQAFGLARFSAAGGRCFGRIFGLAVISGFCYFLLFRLGRWLFRIIEDLTRDVTSERTILLWAGLAAGLVVVSIAFVRLVFDYAKIVAVTEPSASVLGSLGGGLRFVTSRPLAAAGLLFGFGVLGAALVAIYGLVAPGAGTSTLVGILFAFALGQAYLWLRLALRIALLAGEIALLEPSAALRFRGEA